MKKYSAFDLIVVKVENYGNNYYFICRKSDRKEEYIEIFTKEKISINDVKEIIPLSSYYSLAAIYNYSTHKPLKLDINELLRKFIIINRNNSLDENISNTVSNILVKERVKSKDNLND